MTKRAVLAVIAAILVGAMHPAWSGALVNGSFEQEGETPDRAAGWARWGDWLNRETSWRPTRSGKCLLAYHHGRIRKSDSSGLWQDVREVPRGAPVTFSVYASADQAENGKEDFAAVELRLETTLYGEQSTVASHKWSREAIETNGRWSRLAVHGVAPTELLRVLIIVYPGAGGTTRGGAVKFDEARLDIGLLEP